MKNKYIKFLFLILVIAFIVPQITLAVWWNPVSWGVWGKVWGLFHKIENAPQQQQPQIVGGDKDEHGCIGSAGYTWCEIKNKCLRVWEEGCEAKTDIDTSKQISDDTIVNAINKLEGFQLKKNDKGTYDVIATNGYPAYSIISITKGDLNSDGFQDAIVVNSHCGASCGTGFVAVINKNGASVDIFSIEPEGIKTSGADQNTIESVGIDNGIISINFRIWQPVSIQTLTYKFVDNKLAKIISTAGWKTYTDSASGITFQYPDSLSPACAELQKPNVIITPSSDKNIDSNGCYLSVGPNGVTSKSQITVLSNMQFCLTTSGDVGAGQLYRSYYYTTPKNGNYYTLEYVIHTSNGCGVFGGPSMSPSDPNYARYKECLECAEKYDSVVIPLIEKSVSTFKFTTPAAITTLRLWPDVNSFNLVNKTFQAKGMGDSANIVKNIKVYTNNSTKFSSKDMATSMNNFQDMYIMMRDWVGFEWWFNVKGTYQSDGSFLASDISIAGQ